METDLETEFWRGSIQDGDRLLQDIGLFAGHHTKLDLPLDTPLSLLCLVDVHSIPLHLIAGPSLRVETQSPETAEWFEQMIIEGDTTSDQHVGTNLGILARVNAAPHETPISIPITEILFYIHVTHPRISTPPTPPPSSPSRPNQIDNGDPMEGALHPQYSIFALPLSSAMNKMLPTPPISPSLDDPAQLLPSIETCLQLEQESRKRKRIVDVLDEAAESQRRSRRDQFRTGGIAMSSAPRVDAINILIPKRKKVVPTPAADVKSGALLNASDTRQRQVGVLQDVRNPVPAQAASITSLTGCRPPSRNSIDISKPRRTSTLSRVMSASSDVTPDSQNGIDDLETQNKETISRAVMTGLRLYGMQSRRKASHVRKGSSGSFTSPGPATGRETDEVQEDEEYRVVYHQTYRGVVCAYRRHMTGRNLALNPEALQETVDGLLAIFCHDPFSEMANGGKL